MREKVGTKNELADFLESIDDPGQYVILGVGIPRSGRSEALAEMAERLDIRLATPDDVRQRLAVNANDPNRRNREVWEQVHRYVRHVLVNEKEPVIVDGTHIVGSRHDAPERRDVSPNRSDLVKLYRSYGARGVMAVVCHVPIEEALERNRQRGEGAFPEFVLRGMAWRLQEAPVSVDEGFDIVASRQRPDEPIVIEQVASR